MEDKIFNVIKEKNAKSAGHYMKILGIIEEDDSVQFGVPKKNLDLLIILNKIGLIENDAECGKTIDNFHDYLYKLGINTGIGHGKKMIIDSIKEYPESFESLMDINPEDIVNFDIKPTFINDLKESITNEK